jgi:hypothetical protein
MGSVGLVANSALTATPLIEEMASIAMLGSAELITSGSIFDAGAVYLISATSLTIVGTALALPPNPGTVGLSTQQPRVSLIYLVPTVGLSAQGPLASMKQTTPEVGVSIQTALVGV